MTAGEQRLAPDLIKAVQAARRRRGLDEENYRALLSGRFGVVSTKDLSRAQATSLLDEWNGRGPHSRPAAQTVSGRYAGKLRALWLTLYNLGAVENRDDRALIAFVERQTGLSHPRFLIEAKAAAKAIEGLKAMAARESVAWTTAKDARATKIAVLLAQWRKLLALGAVKSRDGPAPDLAAYAAQAIFGNPRALGALDDPKISDAQLDQVQAALGRKLRAARTKAERTP
jgi:hypothetical protein